MSSSVFINGRTYSASLVAPNLWMVRRFRDNNAGNENSDNFDESLITVDSTDPYIVVTVAIDEGRWA